MTTKQPHRPPNGHTNANATGASPTMPTTDREAELAEAHDYLTKAAAIYQRHEDFIAAHQKNLADAFNAHKELDAVKAETVRLLEQRDAEHKRKLRQYQEQLHDYGRQIIDEKAALEDLRAQIVRGQAHYEQIKAAVATFRTRHDLILAKREEHIAWLKSA
jgi:chromosome segregation ATPase